MNLRGFLKYALFRDTTMKGEFRLMQKLAGCDCPRIFIDVGANDGLYSSNSFPFVWRGWRTVLIEPHPAAFSKLQELHSGKMNVVCLNLACAETNGERPLWFSDDDYGGSLSTLCPDDLPQYRRIGSEAHKLVLVERLDSVLAKQRVPPEFGILSIDTEGMDYEVLLGLNLDRWNPRVIVTEDFQPKNERKGEYLRDHGYRHAGQCASNAMWVRGRL